MALRSGPTLDDALWTPPRFFKVATESESSGDEFGILEDDSFIALPRTRTDPCLQSTPAAAPADQPHFPDSVCHSRSGSVRTGTPSSHQDHCAGSPSVLAVNGTWSAALRCVPSADRSLLLSEAIVLTRLYAWRLKCHSARNPFERFRVVFGIF